MSLRPEPFGALAYHYDNRKLNFIRSVDLVSLVDRLDAYPTPRQAFDDLIDGRGDKDRGDNGRGNDGRANRNRAKDEAGWGRFARALDALAASEFLQPVPEP